MILYSSQETNFCAASIELTINSPAGNEVMQPFTSRKSSMFHNLNRIHDIAIYNNIYNIYSYSLNIFFEIPNLC